MDSQDFQQNLRREFLIEASELLEECEQAFLELEKQPKSQEIINQIFRIVHTIKGSSYLVELKELGDFSHTFETLLSMIKEDIELLSPTALDLMLRSNDCMNRIVASLEATGTVDVDCQPIASEIKAHLSTTQGNANVTVLPYGTIKPATPTIPATPLADATTPRKTATNPIKPVYSATTPSISYTTISHARTKSVAPSKDHQPKASLKATAIVTLHCDDSAREAIERLRPEFHIQVLHAQSSAEALEFQSFCQVYLIVLQVSDGHYLTRNQQALHSLSEKAPIIALSDRSMTFKGLNLDGFRPLRWLHFPASFAHLQEAIAAGLEAKKEELIVNRLAKRASEAYSILTQWAEKLPPGDQTVNDEDRQRLQLCLDECEYLSRQVKHKKVD